MGTWDILPWDSDEASQWYDDMMRTTGIRSFWLDGINADVKTHPDRVRAAVGLFIMLGRAYTWPIERFEADVELAISRARRLLEIEEYHDCTELVAQIQLEIEELESRRASGDRGESDSPPPLEPKKWWQLWK